MKSYSTERARTRLARVAREAREGPVELTRCCRRIAVLVSPEDFALYLELLRIMDKGQSKAGAFRRVESLRDAFGDVAGPVFRALAAHRPPPRKRRAPRLSARMR